MPTTSSSPAPTSSLVQNAEDLKMEKRFPEFGDGSPLFAILRVDPRTQETTLMVQFPQAIHIPKHTHEKSESHIILEGSHFFEEPETGKRYELRAGGYSYLP